MTGTTKTNTIEKTEDVDARASGRFPSRSEEHTSELQSQSNLVCRLLLEKKKQIHIHSSTSNNMLISTTMPYPASHPTHYSERSSDTAVPLHQSAIVHHTVHTSPAQCASV